MHAFGYACHAMMFNIIILCRISKLFLISQLLQQRIDLILRLGRIWGCVLSDTPCLPAVPSCCGDVHALQTSDVHAISFPSYIFLKKVLKIPDWIDSQYAGKTRLLQKHYKISWVFNWWWPFNCSEAERFTWKQYQHKCTVWKLVNFYWWYNKACEEWQTICMPD